MKAGCFAKTILNDIRRNPVNYAALLFAIVVCAAVSLFMFRSWRTNVSTTYDCVYTFKINDIGAATEAKELYLRLKNQYAVGVDAFESFAIGEVSCRVNTDIGVRETKISVFAVSGGQLEKFPLLAGGFKAYVPKFFTDAEGGETVVGERVEILGSEYEIAAISEEENSTEIVVGTDSLPRLADVGAIAPVNLAFERRLSEKQLELFNSFGFLNVADDNYFNPFMALAMVGTIILNMLFVFLISSGVLKQNGADMAKLRLAGAARLSVALSNAVLLLIFFAAGFLLAVGIDAAVSANYASYGKIAFRDALTSEDFVIAAAVLFSVFAAFTAPILSLKGIAARIKE